MRTAAFPALVSGVLLLCSARTIHSAPANPAPRELRALEDASHFTPITDAKDLPSAVRRLCSGPEDRLAWIGEPFNAGCVIGPGSPPSTRVIWAVRSHSDGVYVLHVERGGIAHSFHILVARYAGESDAQLRWSARSKSLPDYAAFVRALKNGALTEQPWP